MSTSLVLYNPNVIRAQDRPPLPGVEKFCRFFVFHHNSNTTLCDRTGTIRFPIRLHSLFPIPKMRPMRKTLEEVCDERARGILRDADALDVPVGVMWSGGIDSTLVLVSLIKNATSGQKKRVTVLLKPSVCA